MRAGWLPGSRSRRARAPTSSGSTSPPKRCARRASRLRRSAAALDPGDDPALLSFHDEGVRSLETFTLLRRVLATATSPAVGAADS